MEEIKRLLFQNQQFQILALYHSTKGVISNSYAFAWRNGVFPVKHMTAGWHYAYRDQFDVTEDQLKGPFSSFDRLLENGEGVPAYNEILEAYDHWQHLGTAVRYYYLELLDWAKHDPSATARANAFRNFLLGGNTSKWMPILDEFDPSDDLDME